MENWDENGENKILNVAYQKQNDMHVKNQSVKNTHVKIKGVKYFNSKRAYTHALTHKTKGVMLNDYWDMYVSVWAHIHLYKTFSFNNMRGCEASVIEKPHKCA